MGSTEAIRTFWRAYRTTRPRHAPTTCLACSSRPKLSQAIASCTGAQLSPRKDDRSVRKIGGARRSYSTLLRTQTPGEEIAILGGGLTGLTTAYYLAQFYPSAKITLYESNDRLGGWVDTEEIQVRYNGKTENVVLEHGPRTVAAQNQTPKWDDFIFYDLVDTLGISPNMWHMHKKPGPLMRRYIYYPDHLVDVSAPVMDRTDPMGMLTSWLAAANNVLTEPLFQGMIPSGLNFLRTPPDHMFRQPGHFELQDYSMGEWFARKFGRPDVVNNLLSALVHGIYGGDVWKLSMESGIFRRLLMRDQIDMRDIPNANMFVERNDLSLAHDVVGRNQHVVEMAQDSANWGFLGFFNGFSTLTDALAEAVSAHPNITIKTGEPVTAVRFNQQTQNVDIQSGKTQMPKQYSQVISTLFSGTLGKLTGDALPTLKRQEAVTIQVVNLWYPIPAVNNQYRGFGYLIPDSVPAANNPHAALGVLFDTDRDEARGPILDPTVMERGRLDINPGTKFTVMLGGHHWDWLPADSWPDAKEAAEMAKDTIARQLGIPESYQKDVVASTKVCRECIPQHHVGHTTRMRHAHEELLSAFRGKLTVAGGSYTQPGVLPSLRAGRDVAMYVAGEGYIHVPSRSMTPLNHVGETGLGWTSSPLDLSPIMKSSVPFRYGNPTT